MRLLHPAHEKGFYAVVLRSIPQQPVCHDEGPTWVNHVLAKCGGLSDSDRGLLHAAASRTLPRPRRAGYR